MNQRPMWMHRLPNQLTIFRMSMVPILLIIYPLGYKYLNIICGFLFIIASITDFLDGYFARKFAAHSKLGQIIDPIADKLLSAAGLLILVHGDKLAVPLAGILLCRDVGITSLRLVAAESRISIDVSQTGKIKTFFQSAAISLLILHEPVFSLPIRQAGMIALWIAIILSVYSAYEYVKFYAQQLSGQTD